jgi:hypothetical protein
VGGRTKEKKGRKGTNDGTKELKEGTEGRN